MSSSPWDMDVKSEDLDSLTLDPENARQGDVDAIKASLKEFGQTKPILCQLSSRKIIAGNHTAMAATKLKWPKISVRFIDCDDRTATRIALADNGTGDLAVWDEKVLLTLGQRVNSEGDPVPGFSDGFWKKLASKVGSAEGGELKDPSDPSSQREGLVKKWGTARGQLWQIGPHRLLIDDSSNPRNWQALMGDQLADMVHTDPPYGVSYESRSGDHDKIRNDELTGDALVKFLQPILGQLVQFSKPTAAHYIWHASSTREDFAYVLKSIGLEEKQYLIWAKPIPVLGWGDYRWAHEPCFYACRAGESPSWHAGRDQSTIWRLGVPVADGTAIMVGNGMAVTDGQGNTLYLSPTIPRGKKVRTVRIEGDLVAKIAQDNPGNDLWEVSRETNALHPTQKPVALARRAIGNSTASGELVLDAFLGSGCTMIAAEQLGRVCYGTELMPEYGAVILERMTELGLTPALDGSMAA